MIAIESLTKRFDGTVVLDDLSLSFGSGERVALVGANGAGKTTLVRCLLGEYRHEGRVSVGGLAPREARREVLRRVGFVPQLPPPLKMPAGQLISFAADLCGTEPSAIEAVATRLGLDPAGVRRRPFARLSGGQKQKLLIACALGRDCDLLILDEPAANLDPGARAAFFGLLAERAGGATMLISSHRLDEVAALVERVVELDRGRVALDDHVADAGVLGEQLSCRVVLDAPEETVAAALHGWGLRADASGRAFEGRVAGPDRLRFLGFVARHSGRIRELRLGPEDGAGREGA